MGTLPRVAAGDCRATKSAVGRVWTRGRTGLSTMWLSWSIGSSSSGVRRCWDWRASARPVPRRVILVLPPIRRQAMDAFAGHLSGCADCAGPVVPSRRVAAAIAHGRRGPACRASAGGPAGIHGQIRGSLRCNPVDEAAAGHRRRGGSSSFPVDSSIPRWQRSCRAVDVARPASRYRHGSALWSVSHGLARNGGEYKRLLMAADEPRRNDLAGGGVLSLDALIDFYRFFVETCLDQIRCMRELRDSSELRRRMPPSTRSCPSLHRHRRMRQRVRAGSLRELTAHGGWFGSPVRRHAPAGSVMNSRYPCL